MADTVELDPRLESSIAALLETGRFASRSEVLSEGVRLLTEREARLADRDAAIARGVADAEAGRVRPTSEVADRLVAKYGSMAASRDA